MSFSSHMQNFFNRTMGWLGFEQTMDATKRRIKWRRKRPLPPRLPSRPVNRNQVSSDNKKPIHYLMNDMTTPSLVKVMQPPEPMANPSFAVVKYDGGGFGRGQEQANAANCFVTVTNTINFLNKHTDKKIQNWATKKNLHVIPRAGRELNAFYNRRTLSFFYFDHKHLNQTLYTADSADIVAHELGHAILDSYRPDTWGAASLEIMSFHESFADLVAMLNIMSHEEILAYALNQNNNDMRKPSVITNLAEHIGGVIFKFSGGTGRNPDCLRSAINDFKYVNPGTLPKKAPNNKLAAECHSFGRIFLGAFYDILVMIYDETRAKGHSPMKALEHARDAVAKRVLFAVQNAPLNVRFMESVAKTMLWAEKTKFGNTYYDKMRQIFFERNLMKLEVKMLSVPECTNDEGIVRIQSTMNLRLGDHLLRAQSHNPLYDVELEIPHDQVYLYDNDNNIYDSVLVSDEETLSAAQDAIIHLHDSEMVGLDDDTEFEIQDGKLCRTLFK